MERKTIGDTFRRETMYGTTELVVLTKVNGKVYQLVPCDDSNCCKGCPFDRQQELKDFCYAHQRLDPNGQGGALCCFAHGHWKLIGGEVENGND